MRIATTLLLLSLFVMPLSVWAQAEELPLGATMPMADHTLRDVVSGEDRTLNALSGEAGTLVIFWSNQCAWVDKYEKRVLQLITTYDDQGISSVLINSNDASAFPSESAKASRERAAAKAYPAYVMDQGSQVALAFGATRTPHVYLFDDTDTLVYVGTIDDSPGDPENVSKTYLNDALAALVAGSEIPTPKTKAFGCMLKYAQ